MLEGICKNQVLILFQNMVQTRLLKFLLKYLIFTGHMCTGLSVFISFQRMWSLAAKKLQKPASGIKMIQYPGFCQSAQGCGSDSRPL